MRLKPFALFDAMQPRQIVGECCFFDDAEKPLANLFDLLVQHREINAHELCAYRGEFAFALWDEKKRTAFAACDPMGSRALFYALLPHKIVFSCSIKALLALPEVNCGLNEAYLAEAFSTSLCAEHTYDEHTLYQGIKRLPAGHYLTWHDNDAFVARYWHLDDKPVFFSNDQDYVDGFYAHLHQAVQRRIGATDMLALEVSGGIDSLAIAATARQIAPQRPMIAFSNTCPASSHPEYQFTSEKRYADRACQHLKIQQISMTSEFDLFAALDTFQEVLPGFVEDVFSFMNIGFYELAQQHEATVVLSGFGGDQVATQHAIAMITECRQDKRQVRGFIEWWLLNGTQQSIKKLLTKMLRVFQARPALPERYRHFIDWISPLMEQRLHDFTARQMRCKTVQAVEARYAQGSMYGFLTSRPATSNILAKAYGVQHRYPMLDVDLLNYCHNVPAIHKRRWGIGRRMVRKAIAPYVPHELIYRDDKTSATCPEQIIRMDQSLIQYFADDHAIPETVRAYVCWPKLQAHMHKHGILDGSMRRALLYILQLERLNQRFGFLD